MNMAYIHVGVLIVHDIMAMTSTHLLSTPRQRVGYRPSPLEHLAVSLAATGKTVRRLERLALLLVSILMPASDGSLHPREPRRREGTQQRDVLLHTTEA